MVDEQNVDIAVIKTELKGLALNMDAGFNGVNDRLDKTDVKLGIQNGNISDLNKFRFVSIGVVTAVTFLLSVFGATIIALVVSNS